MFAVGLQSGDSRLKRHFFSSLSGVAKTFESEAVRMWFAASQAAVHERPMNSTLGCLVPATAPGIPAYKQMKEECLLAAFGDGAPLGCSVCNVPWLRALFGSFYFVISEHTCLLVLTGGLGRPKKLEAQTDKMRK